MINKTKKLMLYAQLVKEIQFRINSQSDCEYPYNYAKPIDIIEQLISDAGYKIQIHQQGIRGSFVCLVLKNTSAQ